MLTIAKFDRYDMVNNPMDSSASFTIWFSGCNLRCKDCYNKRLWDREYGDKYSVDAIVEIIKTTRDKLNIKSVVLLGGEPLQQSRRELLSLCRSLNEAGLKVWLYTGYEFTDVKSYYGDILEYIYTIKCGRYVDKLRQDGFPASSNQMIYRSIAGDWVNITEEIGGITIES